MATTTINPTESLLQWFESMEAALSTCNFLENLRIKYVASTHKLGALTWWNSHIRTQGHEPALALPWAEFRDLLTRKYCQKSELQKMETELWGQTPPSHS